MSLVLEESEDISVELLSLLLASVKKGDEVNYFYHFYGHKYSNHSHLVSVNELAAFTILQEVLPVARKLAERVLESSGTKLKPYLIQAVQTLGISFDDYSKVVASICQETSGDVEQNEDRGAGIDMVILSLISR